jgi:Ras GTPase-activating-like protein IQGAP2/3
MYINVAVHYVRPKQVAYVRETLQAIIREVVHSQGLDLEVDPSLVSELHFLVLEISDGVFLKRSIVPELTSKK